MRRTLQSRALRAVLAAPVSRRRTQAEVEAARSLRAPRAAEEQGVPSLGGQVPRRTRLHIALLSPVPPDPSGTERARIVAAEAAALAARGHVVTTPRWPASDIRGLAEALTRDGAQLAHVHGVGTGVAAALATSVPVVLSLLEQDGLAEAAPELGGGPEGALRAAADLGAATWVVFPSVAHVVRVRDRLPLAAGRVRVVPPGHGLKLPRGHRRPRPFDGRGALRVFHPGPLDADGGGLDLVAAIEALPAGRVELVALGGPPPGLGRRPWLELTPRATDGELARLAARCHLAALPSARPESYALGLDEVFALGLPAWVTCGTVAAERYDRGAFEVLPPCAPGVWAEALAELAERPARSVRAFEALPDELPTAARAAASLETLYDDVLATARRAARDAA